MPDLSNSLATFSFAADATSGLKLASFTRAGSAQTWLNADIYLWKAQLYDTTSGSPYSTTALLPDAAHLGAVSVQTDAAGSYIVAKWTALPAGTDFLDVTVTLRLNTQEDGLRYTITSAWNGTAARYALDSISPPSLKIDPLNAPNDVAVLPAVLGIISQDPITNLRFANGVPGFPTTTFGLSTTNKWTYPAGRGWPMGLWGYYDSAGKEGWMVWLEDWSLEMTFVTFESDGTRLVWQLDQPQPDHVLIGNNSQPLGSKYTFRLRPFLATTKHGWWDIGRFYRSRVNAIKPLWHKEIRPKRTDISTTEKAYTLFLDVLANDSIHSVGDGKPGDLAGMIQTIRDNCGATSGTHVSGIVEASDYNLHLVGESPNGDLQSKLVALDATGQIHLGFWFPGTPGPDVWAIERWNQAPADQAELRWWTNNDVTGALRMQRAGYLDGGGSDRLAENSNGSAYYRERVYAITGWNGGTKTVSVTGSPSTDGFSGKQWAILIPASSSARLARSEVLALGVGTVQVVTDFTDALGAVVTPNATYTLEVVNAVIGPGVIGHQHLFCPHAQVNADSHLTLIKNNTSVGAQAAWGASGAYRDVYTEPQMQSQLSRRWFCYRDHSSWSKINAGYTRHPYGGGDWYKRALRDFVSKIKEAARDRQFSLGKIPFFWLCCEDMEETLVDVFDFAFHVPASGNLWRITTGFDPAIHKYLTVPLFGVVYAGKTFGRAVNHELSSGLLEPNAPFNDPALHAFQGYALAAEWVYGITLPTLSLYEDDTVPFRSFWNDAQYVSGGGSVSNVVKQLRDLWVQIITAETRWVLDFLRYGEFMAPAVLDMAATTTTTGLVGTSYGGDFYSYDTLYSRSAYPRVVHGVWRATGGAVCVVMANWSSVVGAWSGTIDLLTLGLGAPGSDAAKALRVQRLDYHGDRVEGDLTFDPNTGKITLSSVAAYSTAFVVLMSAEGSMTRTDLENCVLDFCNTDLANAWFTQAELDHHLRDGEVRMFVIVANKNEDFFKTTSIVSETQDQATVDLPANCYRVLKVERISGNGSSTTRPLPLRRLMRNTDEEAIARGGYPDPRVTIPGTSAFPMYYYQQGQKKIELFPTPSQSNANSLKVTYIFRPATMTSGAHVPFQEVAGPGGIGTDNLEEFQDIICKYAAYMLLLKEESPQAPAMYGEMQARIAELNAFLTPPNTQESKRIRVLEDEWLL